MLDWARDHLGLLAALSVATFAGSLVLIPVLVARMREDFFVTRGPAPDSWAGHHPLLRIVLRLLKNLLGALLVLAGIAMLVLPGQGVLTILLGLLLLDFPGKRRLELLLARRRTVRRAIAWLRRRAGRPPLRFPG